mgnify:CR=1 FL=1
MSPEIIGLVAIIGTTLSGILTTLFTSRCSHIKCCCMECDREVIHTQQDIEFEKEKIKEEAKKEFDEKFSHLNNLEINN